MGIGLAEYFFSWGWGVGRGIRVMPKGVGLWRTKRVGMNGVTFLFSGGKGNFERQSKDIYLCLEACL